MSAIVNAHPDFEKRKNAMWDAFLEKDYETAAKTAAGILQDSFALDAVHIAGLSLTALDRAEEGFNWTCASLSLAQAKEDWYANAVIQFMEKKDWVRSMLFVENGIKDFPESVRLTYMRGLIFCNAQQWEDAIAAFDKTAALDPKFYHAHMSKGFSLHMLGKYDEAIAEYESIYDQAPGVDREEVVNNTACVLLEMAKPYEALELLDREYGWSDRPATVYNKSFLYLGMGRWPEAWHMYRNRVTIQVNGDQGVPVVDQPTAKTLDDIRGHHLFIFHEQGLGDTLQFVRYARLLRPHCSQLTIGVPKSLRRLIENLVMDDTFQVVSDVETEKEIYCKCDVALPMLDAPAVLDQRVDNIPGEVPYFHIPDEVVQQRLLPRTHRLRVGLAWAGAARPENIRAHSIDKRRSVPVEAMEPLFAFHRECQLVSLQMPDHHLNDKRLVQPIEAGFDVLDTMAVIKQLDLVICIDSAVAHMAGSIGKPVWMMSRHDQCWRWFWDGREHTDWYPTMRIFQQRAPHTWPDVVERIVDELDRMVCLRLKETA